MSSTQKHLSLVALMGSLVVAPSAVALSPGNIVVYRIGDGATALSTAAAPIFLDELTTGGTPVSSIQLPTLVVGSNRACTGSGTAVSEGLLTLSADLQYLIATCFDAPVGTASVATTAPGTVNRVVARIDGTGSVDTTTALNDAGGNARGAASTNGVDLWQTGGVNGIRYAPLGTVGASVNISSSPANLRGVNIFGGQLYISTNSGGAVRIGAVGSGTPTTASTITALPGFPLTGGPYAFAFFDLDGTVPGMDTLYVADNGASQIQKYSLVGGLWTSNGSIFQTGLEGLAARITTAPNVQIFLTNGTSILTFTDTTGYNATIGGGPGPVAIAGVNTAYRGIAFTPGTTVPVELQGLTVE